MEKLSYLEIYKDSGLYRQWIVENFSALNARGLRLYKHLNKLSKLSKIDVDVLENEIREEFNAA